MAVQLILKNSAVKDQKPSSGAALAKGELAMNSHALSPALYLKDTDGNIQQVSGVVIGTNAPGSPARGAWWLDTTDNTLRLHDGTNWQKVAGGGGSGGGGGTTTIVAGDAINATKAGDEYTLSWDADITKGLAVVSGKAAIQLKTGGGLKFDGGELAIDPSQSAGVNLGYLPDGDSAGTVTNTDGTDAEIPVATNSVAGLFTGAEKQELASALQPGDDISELNNDAGYVTSSGITGIAPGDGIDVSTSSGTSTVSADLAPKKGLEFDSGKLAVNVGSGLTINASTGEIEAVGAMQYKGNVDLTSATVPSGVQNGWSYTNNKAGAASAEWGTACGSSLASGDAVKIGDYVIYDGSLFDYISTGSTGGTNLSNTRGANSVVVESSTGTNTTIAAATSTKAGVMTAADKASLDGDFVKLDDGGTQQDITGGGGLSTDGRFTTHDISTRAIGFNEGTASITTIDYRGFYYANAFSAPLCVNHLEVADDDLYGFLVKPYVTNKSGNKSSAGDTTGIEIANVAGGASTSVTGIRIAGNTADKLKVSGTASGLLVNQGPISSDKKKAYSINSTGAAPSYFAGSTYIGGTTARNTLEAWLSTLTEEQKQKYRDGTFVAPADVANPGDGKWMRQWWYDQQSTEDQALIDTGELAYPTNLLPENFTDTFALGDDTNINLLSNGTAFFRGRIETTGGINIETERNWNFESIVCKNGKATNGSTPNGDGFITKFATFGTTNDPDFANTTFSDVPGIGVYYREQNTSVKTSAEINASLALFSPNGCFVRSSANENNRDVAIAYGKDEKVYGFYSDYRSSDDTATLTNFNFYASGNAPNYFAGNIGINTDDPQEKLHVFTASPRLLMQSSTANAATAEAAVRLAESDESGGVNKYWDIRVGGGDFDFRVDYDNGDNTRRNYLFIDRQTGCVGINYGNPSGRLEINGGDLGQTAGDSITTLSAFTKSINTDRIDFITERAANGNVWTTAAQRIQRRVDGTSMGYIAFGGTGGADTSSNPNLSLGSGSNQYVTIRAGGNLGINADDPQSKLQIGDESGASTSNFISFGKRSSSSTETSMPFIGQVNDENTNSLGIGSRSSSGDIRFYTGNASAFTPANERVRISKEGNVGVGTDDAQRRLHVADTSATVAVFESSSNRALINFKGSASGVFYTGVEGQNWNVQSNSQQRLSINTAGNVGIANSNPQKKLDVNGDIGGQNIVLENSADNTVNRSRSLSWSFEGELGARILGTRSKSGDETDAYMQIFTGGRTDFSNATATFTADKKVAINKATPTATLDVNGDIRASSGIVFGNTSGNVTSKTLNDYEEGTFSLTNFRSKNITGIADDTAIIDTINCKYLVVGNLVQLQGQFTIKDKDGNTIPGTFTGDEEFKFNRPFPTPNFALVAGNADVKNANQGGKMSGVSRFSGGIDGAFAMEFYTPTGNINYDGTGIRFTMTYANQA